MRTRLFALLVGLVLLALPQGVLAAPAPDPPLTYHLTVYGRNPARLAVDGTRVEVWALPRPFERATGMHPTAPCASSTVKDGSAEFRVDITTACPAGLPVSWILFLAEGGAPITGESEPPIAWRSAYSEATAVENIVVRPIPPRTGGVPAAQIPVVCPPNLPAVVEAQSVRFGDVSFDVLAGRFRWIESPVNSGYVVICGVNAGVRISLTTCVETGRLVTDEAQNSLFDAIVASCRIVVR